MSGQILLVEDDKNLAKVLQFHLEEAGHHVTYSPSADEALSLDLKSFELILTDLNMPGTDGLEFLAKLKALNVSAAAVVLTAYGSTDRAVAAMQAGAFHYVEKPVHAKALLAIVERALEFSRVRAENQTLRGRKHEIISASPSMSHLLEVVDRVADTDHTILIRGESGTGKELVARALHNGSSRAKAAFVAVNCAAIPDELLESTLFGHEKGAFTGATARHEGKFLLADGGTIFLDEIAEMSLRLQAKLLRILQESELEVVGGGAPKPVDIRVIAATNQDLEALMREGHFREDLFYRINVVPLFIPPLRHRPEDIPVLLRFFLRKHAQDKDVRVSRGLDAALIQYHWPGNVRELENVAKRMLVLRRTDTLELTDLPGELSTKAPHVSGLPFLLPPGQLDLKKLENDIIRAALDMHQGNQSATARYLNIPRHVLLYRLEKMEGEHE